MMEEVLKPWEQEQMDEASQMTATQHVLTPVAVNPVCTGILCAIIGVVKCQ